MKKIEKKHKSIFNIVLETIGEEKNKMFLFIFLTMLMVIFNLLTNFVNKIFLDSLKNDKPSMSFCTDRVHRESYRLLNGNISDTRKSGFLPAGIFHL